MTRRSQREPTFDRRTFLGSSTLGLAGFGLRSSSSEASSGVDSSHEPGQEEPATIRDLRTTEKPVRDVRAHGATGDGETDDTAAIQATLDGADHGDAIYFPPGNYRCTEKLTQAGKALSLRGAGMSVSEITFDTDDGGFELEMPRPTDEWDEPTGHPPGAVTVTDLSLITTATGGGTALDISWPFYHSSIYFHSIIRNVELIGHLRAQSGWTTGIVLTESWQTILDGVDFVGAGQDVSGAAVYLHGRSIGNVCRQLLSYHTKDGVVLNGQTEGFRLTHSGFAATTYGLRSGPEQTVIPQVVCHSTHASVSGTAVKLRKVDQAYISGCNFWTEVRAPDDYTDPVIALGRPREARVTDNALIAKAGGIRVDGGSRTHVGGNVIKVGNEMAGIRLAHAENTTVTSNQIWTVESGVEGIVIDGGDGITVVGNTLTGTAEGIRFTDGVDDAIAGFNLWMNPDGEDVGDVVIDEGSNTLVAQNLRSGASQADDGTDEPEDGPDEDDEADALPGFGVGTTAVGVGGVAMALAARKGRGEASD